MTSFILILVYIKLLSYAKMFKINTMLFNKYLFQFLFKYLTYAFISICPFCSSWFFFFFLFLLQFSSFCIWLLTKWDYINTRPIMGWRSYNTLLNSFLKQLCYSQIIVYILSLLRKWSYKLKQILNILVKRLKSFSATIAYELHMHLKIKYFIASYEFLFCILDFCIYMYASKISILL